MTSNARLELLSELSRIARYLDRRSLAEGEVAGAITELRDSASALGVPTNSRRDDAPVFIEGTESIETATWTQCGGILFALAHDNIRDSRAIATRIAQRLFELAPTHR